VKLKGRIAVVTGAASGIGKAIARALVAEGALVELLDLNAEMGNATIEEIKASGGEGSFRRLDVSKADEVARVAKAILADLGHVDILVNNAGIWRPGRVTDLSEETWDSVNDTNVKSVYLMSKFLIPSMIERKAGVVVNIASVAGLVGAADASAYAASKGAIVNLTRSMALDFAPYNVRVNCVCPGMMDTAMGDVVIGHYYPDRDPAEAKRTWQPLGRAGRPEDVAKAVIYIASDDAAFMTGSVLVVDGGLTAQ
jgi:NAD(P)-dependent dehydrogenase (short-subunit alcohol dehydrogenase family)